MVTGNQDEIKLLLVADRADIERQLSQGFDATVGKAPKGGPTGGRGAGTQLGAKGKPVSVNPGASMTKALAGLGLLGGIAIAMVGLLKNSQVMKTTTSAFMSILGAMVDILLVAFMPFITEILQMLVGFLPSIQEFSTKYAPRFVSKLVELARLFESDIIPLLGTMADNLGPFIKTLNSLQWKMIETEFFALVTAVKTIARVLEWMQNHSPLSGFGLFSGGEKASSVPGGIGPAAPTEGEGFISKALRYSPGGLAKSGIENVIELFVNVDKEGNVSAETGGRTVTQTNLQGGAGF